MIGRRQFLKSSAVAAGGSRPALGVKSGERIRIASRRGDVVARAEVAGRNTPPKGTVFVPFFDEHVLINLVTLDAFDPISKEPDFKKCAVRVSKV